MRPRQDGQIVYLMAFALAVLLGAAGLAVDTGYSYYYASKGDTAAIAAANGGAQLLPDLPAATRRALILVAENDLDPREATVAVDPSDSSRLVVTVRKTFPVLLIKLLGGGPTSTVARTATSGSPLTGAVVPAVSPGPVSSPAASPSPAAPRFTDIPIPFQWCSNPGQLCDAIFHTTITTGPTLQMQYLAPPAHCSDGRVYLTLDGMVVGITNFVSGGQATLVDDFGTVTPGPHTVTVQFEGRVSGCNTIGPGAWFGTLRVYGG